MKKDKPQLKHKRPIALLAALLVAGLLFAAWRMIGVRQYVVGLYTLIHHLGPWGGVAYVIIYVAAMLFLIPGIPFTLAAAFLFGTFWGYIVMQVASTLAAVAGFAAGRYLARSRIEKKLAGTAAFQKMKRIVEKNHRTAIAFIQVMPLFPFGLTNYAFGLTRVSFWSFLFYSEIIFIPMNAVLVLGARAIYMAAVHREISWGLLLGTVGAGLFILVLRWVFKKAVAVTERVPAPSACGCVPLRSPLRRWIMRRIGSFWPRRRENQC